MSRGMLEAGSLHVSADQGPNQSRARNSALASLFTDAQGSDLGSTRVNGEGVVTSRIGQPFESRRQFNPK